MAKKTVRKKKAVKPKAVKKPQKARPIKKMERPKAVTGMAGLVTETDMPRKILRDIGEYAREKGMSKSRERELLEKARGIYKASLYDPEEAVGVVAAQSLSEPTTQMSLDGSERVIVKRDGAVRIVTIGEFVDAAMASLRKECTEGWEVCDMAGQGVYVPGITQGEKIVWRPVTACSRHRSPDSLLEIATLSGRRIVATDSHSFVTRSANMVVSVSGKDLKCGERIPSLKYLPENCIQQLELRPILKEQRFAKKRLPETLKLTKELGWIFGAYIAEGNCTPNFVSFSNTNDLFLSRIREFARMFGFSYNEYDNTRGFALSHDIRVNSKQLSRLMEKTCGTGSKLKRVPDFAYSSREDFVSGLLRGYFDGDGNVSVSRRVLRASSRSKELIDGIALLLSRFGIFANKHKGREFSLSVPYKYAGVFRERIGFTIEGKAERLEQLCRLYSRQKTHKDNTDAIGGFGDMLLRVSRKLGLPTRSVNSFTRRQRIGREALLKHIGIFEEVSARKGIDISHELGVLKSMYDSDVVWDEITGVSRVKPSGRYVYDFTVGGTETFTTFDGIVTHNTMRTYHFAGTAGIQVTLGLPRLLEIFDARKEPKTPTMTIHLEKNFQSPEKARKVAENIKEVKLRDVIVSDVLDLTNLEIRCKLDTLKIARLEIPEKGLPKKIKLRNINVKVEGDELVASSRSMDLKNLRKLKYKLLETHVKGIKGISQAVVNKEEGEWIINTMGSNLKKVFEIDGVDVTRTSSNNIFEILDVLGVEAARNVIVRQSMYTIEEQGLGVDIRYTMLLADLMTVMGNIRAIGRYGIAGQKASVLARAAFEETKNHLIRAAIRGEKDYFRGVVENVMVNQVIPIGTGAFSLKGWIAEKGK